MRILAIDGALNNFGICLGEYNGNQISINDIRLYATKPTKTEKIFNDAKRANEIARFLRQCAVGTDLVVAEIAYGSKSSRAAWSLGVTLGLIVSIDLPILFVKPFEVKNVVRKGADKAAIIDWARRKYPTLAWTGYKGRDEHMADAIAVAHAGYTKMRRGKYTMLK